jgi:hypothetical protein
MKVIFTNAEIYEIVFREAFIYDIFSEQEKALEFLAKMNLVRNSMLCVKCGNGTEMTFQTKKEQNRWFYMVMHF